MPVEIKDLNKFLEIASRAVECRVVRKDDGGKIKARTRRYLYTYVVSKENFDEILEKIKEVCKNLIEISAEE
jgi:hypothetical protein